MKSLTKARTMRKKYSFLVTTMQYCLLLMVFVFGFTVLHAQDGIPESPNPPKLYTNLSTEFPNFLSQPEAAQLENDLEAFEKETSNQIVVVVVDDLAGYEPWEFATELGEKWKDGQEKEDNGMVLLIKPTGGKSERKTFIAVGRGLEGAIPDYTCNEIVENELIPSFKQGAYYEGISNALHVLKALSKGEYNSKQYADKHGKNDWIQVFALLFVIFIVVILFSRGGKGGGGFTMGPGGIFFFGSGFRGGNGFGGGSSGGGFGGFGGGSFGGGGSGGSW